MYMQPNQKEQTAKPIFQLKGAYKQMHFYENSDVPTRTIAGQFNRFPDTSQFANKDGQYLLNHLKNSPHQQKSQKKSMILDNDHNEEDGENRRENQQDDIQVDYQPLFFDIDEVDHNIEEIGLMAVREVRYVDDDEWKQMLREQKKYEQAMKRTIMQDIRKNRKIEAQKRHRNKKGQFLPKVENDNEVDLSQKMGNQIKKSRNKKDILKLCEREEKKIRQKQRQDR